VKKTPAAAKASGSPGGKTYGNAEMVCLEVSTSSLKKLAAIGERSSNFRKRFLAASENSRLASAGDKFSRHRKQAEQRYVIHQVRPEPS